MLTILIPVITLCVLGLCFGIGLSFLSKRFTVHVDERIEKILALLPGANCGACGQPGCAGFAQALLDKSADLGRCVVCDKVIKQKIAEILGVELSEDKEQRSAFNACGGGSQAIDKFIYYGIYDCLAAAM
ncbi:MAG: RnfABCDGE type electron transport complex subunit B, partial [Candidatus Omnitrophota bacterium]